MLRAQEAGLREAQDEDHFAIALREKRVIVTQDADFLAKHDRGDHHFGIAYCKQGSRSIGEMVAALDLIYQVMEPQEMVNHVEYM